MDRHAELLFLAGVAAVAVILTAVFLTGGGRGSSSLPTGCTKPPGGYLVIASNNGYNDSIGHGAPANSWPVITVQKGSTVNITVCNTDVQPHGFQITHYFDRYIESVAPGSVIHVSFVADVNGTFRIYCSIFCTIHVFMQNGELVVLS
jgi:hypothetical protein